jgi:F-box-like
VLYYRNTTLTIHYKLCRSYTPDRDNGSAQSGARLATAPLTRGDLDPHLVNQMSHRSHYDDLAPEDAIRKIQSKIASTEALLSFLKLELDRQRRRRCPIMKLTSDELMAIFELSSEEDWRCPVSIAAVCHRWRAVVHDTPKAWYTLRLPTRPPLNIISMYLAYSKPFPLHLSTPNVSPSHAAWKMKYIDIINQNADRIECLGICGEELDMLTGPFRRLRQLDLWKTKAGVKISSIPRSRFPSLSHVRAQDFTDFDWHSSSKIINPPPIQELSIRADDELTWLKILVILEKTLVSLSINAYCPDDKPMIVQSLHFPLLKYLEILPHERFSPWHFKAKTPSLRSYFLNNKRLFTATFSVEVDFALITHLRLAEPVNLALYPRVHHLRLEFPPDKIVEMIEFNPDICPLLESIEYLVWSGTRPTDRTSVQRQIRGSARCVKIIPCTFVLDWKIPLPAQYPHPVSAASAETHFC